LCRLSHAVALLKLFIGWISNLCGVDADPYRICVILCGSTWNIWGSVKTSLYSTIKTTRVIQVCSHQNELIHISSGKGRGRKERRDKREGEKREGKGG
jgi:hypothetical protein